MPEPVRLKENELYITDPITEVQDLELEDSKKKTGFLQCSFFYFSKHLKNHIIKRILMIKKACQLYANIAAAFIF